MFGKTVTKTVKVLNQQGIHARPSLAIMNTVRKYQATVTLQKGAQVVNAGNILDLLSLGAAHGTELIVAAKGDQAEEAAEALVKLFAAEFAT